MIAVDTNILVYAHREDSAHHEAAHAALRALVEAGRPWAVPWSCVHEFLAVVTHPRIYRPPTDPTAAASAISSLLELPGATAISETAGYLDRLTQLIKSSRISGPKIHDARIAALCLSHGISELWTADRDFSYFPELPTRNPLVS